MVPNDGGVAASDLEGGAAVSLHLPPEALRVLTQTQPEEREEHIETVPAAEPT